MALTPPTAAEIKTRFPIFASVDDTIINAVIAEAARNFDETWSEGDYNPAYRYLVAHMLLQEGAGRSSDLMSIHDAAGPVISERIGQSSISYADRSASSVGYYAKYRSTEFGRRYLEILRSHSPGILSV